MYLIMREFSLSLFRLEPSSGRRRKGMKFASRHRNAPILTLIDPNPKAVSAALAFRRHRPARIARESDVYSK